VNHVEASRAGTTSKPACRFQDAHDAAKEAQFNVGEGIDLLFHVYTDGTQLLNERRLAGRRAPARSLLRHTDQDVHVCELTKLV
jgi:hypothetical protein